MPEVEKVYALDLSEDLLKDVGERIIKKLEGNKKKIRFIVADFHKIPLDNKKFDIVICDASLHHAYNLPVLLEEAKRVLKKDGILIAVREPVKSVFHTLNFIKFGKKEIERGSTENIYSKKEWIEYFRKSGFKLDFYEEFNKDDTKTKIVSMPIIKSFNGILFSRYYFLAKKVR